jgi:hypothetical protein
LTDNKNFPLLVIGDQKGRIFSRETEQVRICVGGSRCERGGGEGGEGVEDGFGAGWATPWGGGGGGGKGPMPMETSLEVVVVHE